MRTITTHQVNGCNDQLKIEVHDEPGNGGANHLYVVSGFNTQNNDSDDPFGDDVTRLSILFQNGPIQEVGTNGVTHEALLAILIDRLQSFQKGDYSCRENALALTKLEEAKHWLNSRTTARLARGVEGTHKQ